MPKARIFISYKRNAEPDELIALQVRDRLAQSHSVFIDQEMQIGERWPERIQSELAQSDFLIPFLSTESVHSEMVRGEIETAHKLHKEHGRPVILPVRLGYQEAFEYPLSAYLNEINWASWITESDTKTLLDNLLEAIDGGALKDNGETPGIIKPPVEMQIPVPLAAAQPPAHLELPEGTMDPQSALYVERPGDQVTLNAIERSGGVTITIKGPRQMGKSSLLMRTIARASEIEKRVVFLDFQLFDEAAMHDADRFFRQFCTWLTDELELEDCVDEYWQKPLGNSQLCTRYVGRYLLKELGAPLVLAMDEVESVFEAPFRSDFFSMLRSWHNDRAFKPQWKQLDIVLVTSTEPYQLIENLNQSPFNVGEIVDLLDFSQSQLATLNISHPSALPSDDLDRLMELLAGHPYLTRRAMYLILSGRITTTELLGSATDERGPFGDHLRYHLFRLQGHDDLITGFKQILQGKGCTDEGLFWRLRGAGLVRRDGANYFARCNLYADYFSRHFDV